MLPPLVTEEQLALTTAPDQQPDRLHVLAAQTRLRLFGLLGPAGLQDRAEPGHDPSPALGRQVDTRVQYCTGIGCNQSAGSCDRDHSTAWPTGPTAAWNLTVKSPRCHHLKHQGWTPSTDPHGWHHWQSPLGHTYRRLGVWTAPHRLPEDLTLPDPTPVHLPSDTYQHQPHPQLLSCRKAREAATKSHSTIDDHTSHSDTGEFETSYPHRPCLASLRRCLMVRQGR